MGQLNFENIEYNDNLKKLNYKNLNYLFKKYHANSLEALFTMVIGYY